MTTGSSYWDRFREQRVSRRRALAGAGAGATAITAIAIVGCGRDGTNNEVSSPPSSASAQSGQPTPNFAKLRGKDLLNAIPSAVPRDFEYSDVQKGGTYNWIPASEPVHLDPHLSNSSSVAAATSLTYSRLLRLKGNAETNPYEPEIVGDLAETWEQPDDSTMLLHLRSGVKFHNVSPTNGRALKTDDVLFSLNRVKSDPSSGSLYSAISDVDAPDQNTIRVKTTGPYAPLPMLLGAFMSAILPPELVGSGDGAKLKSAGTGPFVFDSWQPKTQVDWKANNDYYLTDPAGNPLPYVDNVRFTIVSDAAAKLAAMRAGQVDQAYTVFNISNIDQAMDSMPDLQLQSARPWYGNFSIALRDDKVPFNDVRIRRALNMAFDRKGIKDTIYNGFGFEGIYFPWNMLQAEKPTLDDLGKYFQHNVSEAKSLFSAAGVDPSSLSFEVPFYEYGGKEQVLTLIQQMYKTDLGVNMTLKKMEYSQYYSLYKKKQYDQAALGNYGLFFPDLDPFVQEWATGSTSNAVGYSNPALDVLIDKQRAELDTEERKALAKQIYDTLLDEMPVVWLPLPNEIWGWRPSLMNWRDTGWFSSFYYNYMQESVWKKAS